MGGKPSKASNKVGVIRISSVNKIVIMEDEYVETYRIKEKAKGFLEYTEEFYYEEEVDIPKISSNARGTPHLLVYTLILQGFLDFIEERNLFYEDIEESWGADGVKHSKM